MGNSIDEANKRTLIRANGSRSTLYLLGFLTEKENQKVFERIQKWQEKKKINITREELMSLR